jgi:hypothetical protein
LEDGNTVSFTSCIGVVLQSIHKVFDCVQSGCMGSWLAYVLGVCGV